MSLYVGSKMGNFILESGMTSFNEYLIILKNLNISLLIPFQLKFVFGGKTIQQSLEKH